MRSFNLSAWSVAHRSLVGFLIVLLFAGGGYAYRQLGRAEDPSFTVKLMVVSAEWPGATAEEMQNEVAERIERKLQDLAWLDHLYTYTRPGSVVTEVTFRDDMPPRELSGLFYQARKKLHDLQPELPAGVVGPFVNDEYTDVYGAVFALTGADNAELVRQAERIRDRLLRVPGSEKVTVSGEIPRTLFVEFSHARLATLGVTPAEIAQAIARQNVTASAGIVETGAASVPLRVTGAIGGAATLAETPVAANGQTVRLGDIANISRGYQDPPDATIRHNGQPAVILALSMQAGTNGLTFGEAVHQEVARIRADLPAGIELQQIADQAAVVREGAGEFTLKFCAALAVVMAISLLSLGWRIGIVVALAVPLTLAVVFLVMLALGIELQRVSLGALIISLGLLVDDAIISIETMVVKLAEGWDRARAASFAWTSTAFPMLTGTLVTAAGFLPIGVMRSASGEYTGDIFWVVSIALLMSWLVAVTFIPYLGVVLLPAPQQQASHDEIYSTRPYRALRQAVRWCVRRRRLVVLATIALFIASVCGTSLVKNQFFPDSTRDELIVDVTLRQGASHAASEAAAMKLESMLAADPDVRWYTSYIGSGPPRFFLSYNPELPNDAVSTIVLTARDLAARERVRARLLALAAEERIPEARLHVKRLEMGPPVGFPVQFRVVGDNLSDVRHGAETALEALRSTPGTRNAQLAWGERALSMRLELDQPRIRQLGLSSADIAESLQTLLSGAVATQVRDSTKLVSVVLRAVPGERLDLGRLPDLMLSTGGGPIALSQIARLAPEEEDPVLWRRDREPYINVQADIQDGLQGPDVTAAALPRLNALALPSGVRIETGGATEESAKANAALLKVFPLTAGAMVLLLMIQLQTLPRTLLVLATAPLGLIGAVLALLVTDAAFGFVALLGLIALGGMIMRNTVILVDQVRQDLEAGRALEEAIVESTVRRARPVVLTALASALAFIPLTTNVFWGPMALCMVGGLAVATELTLLFLPALYAWSFRASDPVPQAEFAERRALAPSN